MLRAILIGLSAAAVAGGALLTWTSRGQAWLFLFWPVLILLGLLFERVRYKRPVDVAPSGPEWRDTGERSIDPVSGEAIEVRYNPVTGARAYVRRRAARP